MGCLDCTYAVELRFELPACEYYCRFRYRSALAYDCLFGGHVIQLVLGQAGDKKVSNA